VQLGLTGRRAAVTGASRGIGLAIADELGQEGVDLALCARSPHITTVAEELADRHGVTAAGLPIDLSEEDGVQAFATRSVEILGGVDILVNNAGGIPGGTLHEIGERSAWEPEYNAKLWGYVELTRLLISGMVARRDGVVINIIGLGGADPRPDYVVGSLANAALMNFTRNAARAHAADGVRVVGINPGPIDTGRYRSLNRGAPETQTATPMGRLGAPAEVASVAVFLASPRASFVTGTVLHVAGGD
jgi:NAD(P)-dependent dehydrogenase (short-subunit alcohol dehydrogenase family)